MISALPALSQSSLWRLPSNRRLVEPRALAVRRGSKPLGGEASGLSPIGRFRRMRFNGSPSTLLSEQKSIPVVYRYPARCIAGRMTRTDSCASGEDSSYQRWRRPGHGGQWVSLLDLGGNEPHG